MRISDWSSDVCSSDLIADQRQIVIIERKRLRGGKGSGRTYGQAGQKNGDCTGHNRHPFFRRSRISVSRRISAGGASGVGASSGFLKRLTRSEEHTSELQSLMRISYAVFCLKKKNKKKDKTQNRP